MVAVPATPYRGIQPFRYVDHPIFFAREEESRYLARLVAMYRGVFLYGESGNGKSSLINAALIPEATRLGFQPERVRLQPRSGEELVIERIATAEDEAEWLPSQLAPPDDDSPRVVLSIAEFEDRVRAASGSDRRSLLIFDQFEELLTLFEEARADESQRRIVALLVRLLREDVAIKLLFAFREDYLGKVTQLLAAAPDLIDQALRLPPPAARTLATIIRGPFERYPGHFDREIAPGLAERLRSALAARFGAGDLSLSEVQTVCLRLWQADDPDALLTQRGAQGLLEDYLGEALDAFPPDLRGAAITLLGQMVTSSGTRNVMSAEDLIQRVRADEDIPPSLLQEALDRLESESRLIRRERRRDLYLYEVTSEFLLPWIGRHRDELRRAQERRRYLRRVRVLGSLAAALLIVAAAVTLLALYAVRQKGDAQDQRNAARLGQTEAQDQRDEAKRQSAKAEAFALASLAKRQLQSRPDVSLLLALAAYRASGEIVEARSSLLDALPATEGSLAILHGHTGRVGGIAFSPDGRTIASASDDSTVRLWDAESHRQLGASITGPRDAVYDIAFSPDGTLLAAAGGDGKVRIYDVPSHEERATFNAHAFAVSDVEFSPDGKILASAGYGRLQLWDVLSHRRLDSVRTYAFRVAFSAGGRRLATAGSLTQLWAIRNHKLLLSSTGPRTSPAPVLSISFSPGGRILATGDYDGKVRLWNARTFARLRVLDRSASSFSGIAFSPDGRMLASAGDDDTIRLWSVRTGQRLGAALTGHTDDVTSIAFNRDGRRLASASSDSTIRLWDVKRRAPRDVRLTTGDSVRTVAISPDGKIVASAGRRTIRLWNRRTHKQIGATMTGHENRINSVAFTPDGKTLASGSDDQTLRLWDVATHKQLAVLRGYHDWVNSVAFSPDGTVVASGSDDSTVRLWDVRTHKQLKTHSTGPAVWVKSVAFSPDGKLIASGSDDRMVRLWDARTLKRRGRRLARLGGNVSAVAFSPDGKVLAAASDDRTIRLWDVASRTELGAPLAGHRSAVKALAFSPDGRTLASASMDKTVRLWDVGSRTPFGPPLAGHARSVNAVAFTPGGKVLVSASGDKTIRLRTVIPWSDFAKLRDKICARVDDLSDAEWKRYVPDIPYRRSCER